MTLYTVSNNSLEAVDPLKQSGQNPPPTYSPLPDPVPSFPTQEQDQQEQQQPEKQQTASGKSTFGERLHKISSKAGWPLNKAANVIGAEGWWPTGMDRECNKAARILHSFTSLDDPIPSKTNAPIHPVGLTRKSMVKIPPTVLQNCAGLAIFNVLRAGACHGSLAGGSGVVIARRPDGTWSPPSSFVVTTLGAGFVFGLDVYDCVCVLNTREQVEAFTRPRLSLGAEGSVAVGPVGTGGHVAAAVSRPVKPVWSYMKSRGLWAGVQIDGTIIVTRADANAVFYKERGITARRILQEDVAWPEGAKPLFEVLRAIKGRKFDQSVVQEVAQMPTPGDTVLDEKRAVEIVTGQHPAQQEQERESEEAKSGEKEEKYETAMEEKERLAKSGY